MRVVVRYDEQPHGFFFPRTMTYAIFTIDFSDEEKEIIRQRNLERYEITGFKIELLLTPNLLPDRWWHLLPYIGKMIPHRTGDVTIREVLLHRTFIYRANEVALLNGFEIQLRGALENIKNWIEANKDIRRSSAFEV
jgi:hypothetical protein